jgi:DNA invertase Pin-like site-specific DNA recombinase
MKAIGVVRVSEVGKRGDRLASPDQQAERIAALCEREGITLLRTLPEIDVSGGSPLAKRPGLRLAVEAVESGEANIVVVAYFDRLVRSLKIQEEVVSRVEKAGGRVLAADIGAVTGDTAAQWLSATMLGMVAEYMRRATAERTKDAQRRAVEEFNRAPCPLIPGLRRRQDGTIELHPEEAPIVKRAFEMRVEGASLRVIHRFLDDHGIKRGSLNTRALMLRSPFAKGEIVWGEYRGVCPAIVDRDLFDRVQQTVVSRGRNGKSERLLARLDILRCGTCGGRMSATSKDGGRYPFYRCTGIDCERRATVSARLVEERVVTEVQRLAAGILGRASSNSRARELKVVAVRDQAILDAKIRTLSGLEDEPATVQRLQELRAVRDASRDAARAAERKSTTLEITADRNWDDLTLPERRALIKALIEHVSVLPGRRPDRLRIVARK